MIDLGLQLLGAASTGGAVALLIAPPARHVRATGLVPTRKGAGRSTDRAVGIDERGWLIRGRVVWAGLAAIATLAFLGGRAGVVAAPIAAVGVWVVCQRAEPSGRRRAREAARRELPHLVGLVGDGLRSGRPATDALDLAAVALPGPAADRVADLLPRLRLGVDPGVVWADLAVDPDLGPLGRALARAHETGAAAGAAVDRLAVDLARSARAEVEDRARAVGVRAAVPLTLCLLPSFVLLGIVPVVAALLAGLGL